MLALHYVILYYKYLSSATGSMVQFYGYLLDAQQLWIIEDQQDAADDGPAQEVQSETEQREPHTPRCMTH